jgi:hypothetical protein
MAKESVYVETSLVSYLTARPSRDLIVAAHQQLTKEWWETRRKDFDLFVSQVVLEEARSGNPEAAAKRMTALEGIPLLDVSDAAIKLADKLIKDHAIPKKAAQDALHIAIACVHGMDYLLTWNCKHIANAQMYSAIDNTCREAGYVTPVICTPVELGE